MPGLLIAWYSPFEPPCDCVFFRERVCEVALHNIDLFIGCNEFHFCRDHFLDPFFLAARLWLGVACEGVLDNLVDSAQIGAWPDAQDRSSELPIESGVCVEL